MKIEKKKNRKLLRLLFYLFIYHSLSFFIDLIIYFINITAKLIEGGPLQTQSEFSKQLLSSFRSGDISKVMKMLKEPSADVHAANQNGTT